MWCPRRYFAPRGELRRTVLSQSGAAKGAEKEKTGRDRGERVTLLVCVAPRRIIVFRHPRSSYAGGESGFSRAGGSRRLTRES